MLKMSILGEDGSVTIEKDGVKVVVTAIDGGLLISTTQENFCSIVKNLIKKTVNLRVHRRRRTRDYKGTPDYHQPIAEVDNGKVTVFTEYAKLGKYKEKP